jgi:murein DD-endopeptidase MepM/ murein hydrolase activator NlpD
MRSPNRGSDIPYNGVRAPIHVDLLPCEGARIYNTRAVGDAPGFVPFTPFIFARSGALLRNPTDGACLSSSFGFRTTWTGGRAHSGIDLANPQGGFVYAAGNGRVVFAGQRGGYGNMIEIDHGVDVRTLYGHLAEINPRVLSGSWVEGGRAIGRMGRTGNASGVHLHYEVTVGGVKVDPLTYGSEPPVG